MNRMKCLEVAECEQKTKILKMEKHYIGNVVKIESEFLWTQKGNERSIDQAELRVKKYFIKIITKLPNKNS